MRTSRAPGAGFDADESSWEWFYRLQLTPCFSVKPDLQWIRRPGGGRDVADVLVGTLRIT